MAGPRRGLRATLGTLGTRLVQSVSKGYTGIKDVIRSALHLGVSPDPLAVAGEVMEARRVESLPIKVRDFRGAVEIPQDLYQVATSEDPIASNFEYIGHMYGRKRKGLVGAGQYFSIDLPILSSKPLTPEEVERVLLERFGAEGEYPKLSDTFSVTVTEAYVQEGYWE